MTIDLAYPLSAPGDLESRYPGVAGNRLAMALLCKPLIKLVDMSTPIHWAVLYSRWLPPAPRFV